MWLGCPAGPPQDVREGSPKWVQDVREGSPKRCRKCERVLVSGGPVGVRAAVCFGGGWCVLVVNVGEPQPVAWLGLST